MSRQRTYIPGLKVFANALCRYIQRYSDKLKSRLPAPTGVLLDQLLAACIALSDALPDEPLNP